jgi:hypothetical protein
MSHTPADEVPDRDTDRQKQAMHDQLRKDVASWSATRSDEATRSVEEFRVTATPPTTRRASRAKSAPSAAPAVQPAAVVKKPFSMFYDGVTTKEHIAYRIARGAR